jgi:beta-1,4-galactosyltransferase 4
MKLTIVMKNNFNFHSSYYGPWFGGVTGLTSEQFWRLNGYSNHYWGWGAEDDDMQARSVGCY